MSSESFANRPAAPWALGSEERAAVRVDRAQTELMHGRPLGLLGAPGADWLMLAAVEALGAARWAAWAGQPGLRLLLSAERLQALGCPAGSGARTLPLPPGLDLAGLQALAAVQNQPRAGQPAGLAPDALQALLAQAQPADAAMQAALDLAKRRQISPALLLARQPVAALAGAREGGLLTVGLDEITAVQTAPRALLRRLSDAQVPLAAHEDCTLVLFRELHGETEHLALIVGQPDLSQPVPVRLHSSCFTGDLLGSLRCDCGDQLQRAIEHLAAEGGVLLYLAQEGRGTGLASKLRAYRLQDQGLDTLDADRYLGFRADERNFQAAAAMLDALGIARIRLLTNNPAKIEALRAAGIDVVDRVPLVAPANPHNARYIATKRERAGHLREDEQE